MEGKGGVVAYLQRHVVLDGHFVRVLQLDRLTIPHANDGSELHRCLGDELGQYLQQQSTGCYYLALARLVPSWMLQAVAYHLQVQGEQEEVGCRALE